jgi:N-acetyl-anhydromuramyl-L-alanine amidase AmpD
MTIYPSIYDGPGRNYSTTSAQKRYIAIHNTSNNASAKDEAAYAKRRTDKVSSHYYVDVKEIRQSLDTKLVAWHAGSQVGNTYAIAYEITGTNDKSRDWWMKNVAWDVLARQIAADMLNWNIANRHLSVSQMQSGGISGIVTHDDMRKAWGGTTHTDPGSNFPMDYLISKISQHLSGGTGGGEVIGDEEVTEDDIKKIAAAVNNYQYADKTLYSLARDASNNASLAVAGINQLAGKDFTDEPAIVSGVLAGLSAEAIAAAIPSDLAKKVVDELTARLAE